MKKEKTLWVKRKFRGFGGEMYTPALIDMIFREFFKYALKEGVTTASVVTEMFEGLHDANAYLRLEPENWDIPPRLENEVTIKTTFTVTDPT